MIGAGDAAGRTLAEAMGGGSKRGSAKCGLWAKPVSGLAHPSRTVAASAAKPLCFVLTFLTNAT